MKNVCLRMMALGALLALSACVTPVSAVMEIPAAQRANLSFNATEVKFDAKMKDSKALDRPMLSEALAKEIAAAAKARPAPTDAAAVLPLKAEVEVLVYKEPNPAMAILLGDNSELTGYVRLYDERDSKQVGEYYVQVLEGAGGLLGLAIADTNETGLAKEFAQTFFEKFEKGVAPKGKAAAPKKVAQATN